MGSAICSRAARGLTHGGRGVVVFRRLLALWPLLAMGFIRVVLTRGIDYHVPTSEYGVYWNFFFTIAVVAVVTSAADLKPLASTCAGVGILASYQVFLTLGGAEYILHAPRLTLFSANREGILGSFGYLGVHWLSVGLGSWCSVHEVTKSADSPTWTVRKLFGTAAACLLAAHLLDACGLPASHRMCNLTYVILSMGGNALTLGILATADLKVPWVRRPMPFAYLGVQESMLATFLLANVLTGFTNLVLQPLVVPCWGALLALSIYTFAWSWLIGFLQRRGITLKL